MAQMRVADLMRDQDLLPRVRRVADGLIAGHSSAVDRILGRWIGDAARYGKV